MKTVCTVQSVRAPHLASRIACHILTASKSTESPYQFKFKESSVYCVVYNNNNYFYSFNLVFRSQTQLPNLISKVFFLVP